MNINDGELIELVRQFPLLYDKKNVDYKNKSKVENSWATIAEFLNAPVESCQNRWSIIRQRFAKERKKSSSIPSGSAAYTVSWPYYSQCQFLEKVVAQRKTVGNIRAASFSQTVANSHNTPSPHLGDSFQEIVAPNKDITPKEDDAASQASFDLTLSQEELTSEAGTSRDSPAVTQPSSTVNRLKRSHYHQSTTKRRKEEEVEKKLVETISGTLERLRTLVETSKEQESADTLFGRSVGMSLHSIKSPRKKFLVKSKIMAILAEAVEDTDD